MNPIEISGLVKSFAGHRALDGLDLSLAQGEIHGFLGPNGVGKSTWLGPLVQLDQAVLDLSPFTHVPSIPGDTMSWPPELLLTAVALSLTAIALTGWQHRDIG